MANEKTDARGDDVEERGEVARPTTLQLGERVLEITDPLNIQPASADVLTEHRLFSNVICLSFANIVTDGTGQPEARVSARIRLPLSAALDLRKMLDTLLSEAMPGKKKAN